MEDLQIMTGLNLTRLKQLDSDSVIENLLSSFHTGLGISMNVCEIECSSAKYSPTAWTP